jgi:hypothetical protein
MLSRSSHSKSAAIAPIYSDANLNHFGRHLDLRDARLRYCSLTRNGGFGIAGAWHEFPCLVFAPQRGAWCNCECMGLNLRFCNGPRPPGRDVAHNGLTPVVRGARISS